jgi:hypothetical protein
LARFATALVCHNGVGLLCPANRLPAGEFF